MIPINKTIAGDASGGNFFLKILQSHIITIATIISFVFAGVVVFNYLYNIGYISLFPTIIFNSSGLITIVFVALVYFLIGGIGLFAPYAFFLYIKNAYPRIKRKFFNSAFITLVAGPLAFVLLFYFYQYIDNSLTCWLIAIICLPIMLFSIYWWWKFYRIKNGKKKWDKFFESIFYLFVCYLLVSLFSIIYGGLLLLELIGNKEYLIFKWIFMIFGIIGNVFLANFLFWKESDDSIFWVMPFIILFFGAVVVGMVGRQVSEKLLYPVRFVERPSDASWYLLRSKFNNDNTAISEFDLKRIQKAFHCVPGEGCSLLYKNHRLNALYGYMAWNVGETRILCPKHIELDKLNKDKCLVIESKYLQTMNDGQYIDIR